MINVPLLSPEKLPMASMVAFVGCVSAVMRVSVARVIVLCMGWPLVLVYDGCCFLGFVRFYWR